MRPISICVVARPRDTGQGQVRFGVWGAFQPSPPSPPLQLARSNSCWLQCQGGYTQHSVKWISGVKKRRAGGVYGISISVGDHSAGLASCPVNPLPGWQRPTCAGDNSEMLLPTTSPLQPLAGSTVSVLVQVRRIKWLVRERSC